MFGQSLFQDQCLNVTEESKQENHLELKVTIGDIINQITSESSVHQINSSVSVRIKILFCKVPLHNSPMFQVNQKSQNEGNIFVLFKFATNNFFDTAVYSITCSSVILNLSNKIFMTDNISWFLVKELKSSGHFTFNVIFNSKRIKNDCPFQTLYDDTEFIDFKLIGEGGHMVQVHGAVLVAQCPLVKKMINDKSIKGGVIEYSDVQVETLQHFKDYLYLRTLPSNNIKQLLLLASKLAMPVLEQQCIEKIISTLTAANTYELTEFALKHKLYDLFINIMDCVQKGKVKVCEIRKCIYPMPETKQ